MSSARLDLRVAVDFGTTYTGVSFDTPNEENNEIQIINKWPGEEGAEDKVPTVLAKDDDINGDIKWGFSCKDLPDDKKWKLFKLLLDPAFLRRRLQNKGHDPWTPRKLSEVHDVVVRFLHQVYLHISSAIPRLLQKAHSLRSGLKFKRWDSMNIEFIFSTPTTWSPPVSQCFRNLVARAGFGNEENHSIGLGLTEAEAAAVFICQPGNSNAKIRDKNVILSIDAGGGTTDLAFVRRMKGYFNLEEVRPVSGIGVGSTKIDWEFAELIKARMNENPVVKSTLPKNFALIASQSPGFQTMKENFGSKDWDQISGEYFTQVAEAERYTHADFKIKEGRLTFTRAELKRCFDKTLELIKTHLQDLLNEAQNHEGMKVDYIVISGGLGSSDYVLEQLKEYIATKAKERNSCVTGSTILTAKSHARKVVIHGLLSDRQSRHHALREYLARANYGIVPRRASPRGLLAGMSTSAEGNYAWPVKYRDTIKACKPVTIKITRKLEPGQQRWTEEIVWLNGERNDLPNRSSQG
ncbi:hypothetical protein H9Q70_001221 [Fusarium xylarioides]|nr:hypothetical protein H9Q70_001221 [Fusarium xylarioides]